MFHLICVQSYLQNQMRFFFSAWPCTMTQTLLQLQVSSTSILFPIQWNLYIRTTLGTNKTWSLHAGGLYLQYMYSFNSVNYILGLGTYKIWSLYKQGLFIYRWSLDRVRLYIHPPHFSQEMLILYINTTIWTTK